MSFQCKYGSTEDNIITIKNTTVKNEFNEKDIFINKIKSGVNRVEFMIDSNNFDFDHFNKYIKQKLSYDIPSFYGENTRILSIGILRTDNSRNIINTVKEYSKLNNIKINKIYNFDLAYSYEDIKVQNNFQNIFKKTERFDGNYYDTYGNYRNNDKQYEKVGLDKKTLEEHWKKHNSTSVTVGILDPNVLDPDYPGFKWNIENGKKIEWRNHWLYSETFASHPNHIGEIIVGNEFGINRTSNLISVELSTWNGLSGEFDFLLSHTKIINNSWGEFYGSKYYNYNWISDYFDWIVQKNPEVINLISAGNDRDDKIPTKEIESGKLSKNSIIVGALNKSMNDVSSYSQFGNDLNYISVVAPGKFVFTDTKKGNYYNSELGTSYSTPVITAIASMLIQEYENIFKKGSDSIIFKSALIAGSTRIDTNHKLISNEYGAGIPNYKNIKKAIENMTVIKFSSIDINKGVEVNLKKGDKVRVVASYLLKHSKNDKTNIDLHVKRNIQESYSYYDNLLIDSSTSNNKNVEVIEFTAEKNGKHVFYLSNGNKQDDFNEVEVALTYVIN
ncbi:S8 family serine peptidase [Mycoplasmopsis felis]|uniref:S8 family serine peptidase n=1 Tax=Mycoplasmopsis felis TaxID=33923 RepID=UPI002B000C3E|nr:S8 family serine peptidase [Mycoplasmopsis felis]WQQ11073.1 S8 family serine peptidase [Mycoplasmopsis felis]